MCRSSLQESPSVHLQKIYKSFVKAHPNHQWANGLWALLQLKTRNKSSVKQKRTSKQRNRPENLTPGWPHPQCCASIPLALGAMAATSDSKDHFMGSDLEWVSMGEETVIEIYSNVKGHRETSLSGHIYI